VQTIFLCLVYASPLVLCSAAMALVIWRPLSIWFTAAMIVVILIAGCLTMLLFSGPLIGPQ
jgi:hypothetical protein